MSDPFQNQFELARLRDGESSASSDVFKGHRVKRSHDGHILQVLLPPLDTLSGLILTDNLVHESITSFCQLLYFRAELIKRGFPLDNAIKNFVIAVRDFFPQWDRFVDVWSDVILATIAKKQPIPPPREFNPYRAPAYSHIGFWKLSKVCFEYVLNPDRVEEPLFATAIESIRREWFSIRSTYVIEVAHMCHDIDAFIAQLGTASAAARQA
jgi:hypothetical protein